MCWQQSAEGRFLCLWQLGAPAGMGVCVCNHPTSQMGKLRQSTASAYTWQSLVTA